MFPWVNFEVLIFQTQGDRNKITPISEVEGSDFFTREIDQALLTEKIDLAVHSSKDLPDKITPGLKVFLETKSLSPFDALVSRNNLNFRELPSASLIGTSSRRRKDRIRLIRPDLVTVDIRGNIEERLNLIDSGKLDALVVAHAALIRLGWEKRISEVFSPDIFPAHPKQGRLSLVVKEEKWEKVKSILSEQARATGN